MSPPNGTVIVPSGTLHGAEVSFECDTGFMLDGNASNECNLTGQWEPGTPTCKPLGDESLTGDCYPIRNTLTKFQFHFNSVNI